MKLYEKVTRFYMDATTTAEITTGNNIRKSYMQISGKLNKAIIIGYCIMTLLILGISTALLFNIDGIESYFIRLLYDTATTLFNPFLLITVIVVGVIIANIIVFIKRFFIYKKLKNNPININVYQRELPTKLKPLHVRMLLNDGLIDDKSIASTILDLVDRGYLAIRREDNNEYSKLDIFKKGDIVLCKTDRSCDDLLSFEKYIIEWFIDKCGDGKEISGKMLSEKISDSENFELGAEAFKEFKALAMLSFPIDTFYDKTEISTKTIIKYVIFIFLGLIPIIPVISPILGVYCLGCLFFASPRRFLNQTGADEKDSWEDLKKYLVDFGDMKSKTPEMISIWNFYLTYSVALGIKGIAGAEIEEFFGDNIYLTTIEQTNRPQCAQYTQEEAKKVMSEFFSGEYKNKIKHEMELLAKEEKKKYDYYKH